MAGPFDFCAGCSVGWEACLGAYWAAEDDYFGCYAPNWYDLNAETSSAFLVRIATGFPTASDEP